MCTDGADGGGRSAYNYMSAIAAFPNLNAGLFEYALGFNVLQKCAVSLLVRLFNGRNAAELCRECSEALFFGLLGHSVVHIRPLVVFAFGRGGKIFFNRAHAAKMLEPQLCVLLFSASSVYFIKVKY